MVSANLFMEVVGALLLVNAVAGMASTWLEWKEATTRKHLSSHEYMGSDYASWRSSVTGLHKVPTTSESAQKPKRNLQGYSSGNTVSTAPSTFNIMVSFVGEKVPYNVSWTVATVDMTRRLTLIPVCSALRCLTLIQSPRNLSSISPTCSTRTPPPAMANHLTIPL